MDDKRAPRSWPRRLERINAIKNVEYEPSSVDLAATAGPPAFAFSVDGAIAVSVDGVVAGAVAVLVAAFFVAAPPKAVLYAFATYAIATPAAAAATPAVAAFAPVAFAVAVATVVVAIDAVPFVIAAVAGAPICLPTDGAVGAVVFAVAVVVGGTAIAILAAFAPQTKLRIRACGLTWPDDFYRTHSDLPHYPPPSPPPIPDEDARARVSTVGSGADPDRAENGEIRANLPPPAEKRSRSTEDDESVISWLFFLLHHRFPLLPLPLPLPLHLTPRRGENRKLKTTTMTDDKREPRSRPRRLERINAIKNVEYEPSSVDLAATAAPPAIAVSIDGAVAGVVAVLVAAFSVAAPPNAVLSAFTTFAIAAPATAAAAPPAVAAVASVAFAVAAATVPVVLKAVALVMAATSARNCYPSAAGAAAVRTIVLALAIAVGGTAVAILAAFPPQMKLRIRAFGLTWPDDFSRTHSVWAASRTHSDLPHYPAPSPPPIPDEDARVTVSIVGSGADPDGAENGEIRANLPPPAERRSRSTEVDEEVAGDEDDPGDLSVQEDEAKGKRLGVTARDLAASTSNYESVVSSGAENSPSKADESSSSRTEGAITVSPNGTFKRVIGSWTKGEHLGSGSFGTVYEAISYDGFFFAVKEVSLLDQGNNAEQCISQLEQEIMLLSRFQHENIVQYLGTEKATTTLYVFLELVSRGSLASLYLKYRLQNSQVSAYTRQILNGLNYLHQQNVVHRDIKCANILVDSNGAVKLADFGLAKETIMLNGLKSCKGSVYWMAPEVARAKPYGRSADIWSLGCTVLEMATGQLPYPNTEWAQAILKIGRGELPPIPEPLTTEARDFIGNCVRVNPSQRPSAAELLEHPFVKRPAVS